MIILLIIATQITMSSDWMGSSIIVFKPSKRFLSNCLQLIVLLAFYSYEIMTCIQLREKVFRPYGITKMITWYLKKWGLIFI